MLGTVGDAGFCAGQDRDAARTEGSEVTARAVEHAGADRGVPVMAHQKAGGLRLEDANGASASSR